MFSSAQSIAVWNWLFNLLEALPVEDWPVDEGGEKRSNVDEVEIRAIGPLLRDVIHEELQIRTSRHRMRIQIDTNDLGFLMGIGEICGPQARASAKIDHMLWTFYGSQIDLVAEQENEYVMEDDFVFRIEVVVWKDVRAVLVSMISTSVFVAKVVSGGGQAAV